MVKLSECTDPFSDEFKLNITDIINILLIYFLYKANGQNEWMDGLAEHVHWCLCLVAEDHFLPFLSFSDSPFSSSISAPSSSSPFLQVIQVAFRRGGRNGVPWRFRAIGQRRVGTRRPMPGASPSFVAGWIIVGQSFFWLILRRIAPTFSPTRPIPHSLSPLPPPHHSPSTHFHPRTQRMSPPARPASVIGRRRDYQPIGAGR